MGNGPTRYWLLATGYLLLSSFSLEFCGAEEQLHHLRNLAASGALVKFTRNSSIRTLRLGPCGNRHCGTHSCCVGFGRSCWRVSARRLWCIFREPDANCIPAFRREPGVYD